MVITLKNDAVSKTIANLYLTEQWADVHFVLQNGDITEKIPAHKLLLASCSPVFDRMFFGDLKEKGDVQIVDADVSGFKEFLKFFYLADVAVTMENIAVVVRLADKYDVLDRMKACSKFILGQNTIENVCWSYQLAVFLGDEHLIEVCEDQIIKSPTEVFTSSCFRSIDKEILERIVKLNLDCNEIEILDACLEWAKNECRQCNLDENNGAILKVQLGDCLKLIRFAGMNVKEYTEIHQRYKGLFNLDEFEDIMLMLTADVYEAKIFTNTLRKYEWDPENIVECRQNDQTAYLAQRESIIQYPEVVSFKSNKMILLGRISTTYIYDIIEGTRATMIIKEIDDESFQMKKILHKMPISLANKDTSEFTLLKPILIKPHTLYEISLLCENEISRKYYYSKWGSTFWEGYDGLRIDFYRNPLLPYDNLKENCISCFQFNVL